MASALCGEERGDAVLPSVTVGRPCPWCCRDEEEAAGKDGADDREGDWTASASDMNRSRPAIFEQ